jgi:excinuclease UvrABC nuclease subunit
LVKDFLRRSCSTTVTSRLQECFLFKINACIHTCCCEAVAETLMRTTSKQATHAAGNQRLL